jgi:hypothetical protein
MDMLNEHSDTILTKGSPEREDVIMWVELGASIMSGVGKRKSIGPVGHFYCLAMDETDISSERVRFFNTELLKRYPGLRKGKRLVNGNTHLGNKLRYVKRIFPDSCLVFLVRNPYAVSASLKRKLLEFPNLMFEIPDSRSSCINIYPRYGWDSLPIALWKKNPNIYNPEDPDSIRLFARYWRNTVLFILDQANCDNGVSFLTIRYEDILCDHQHSLANLLKYCSLSPFDDWKVLLKTDINKKRINMLSSREKAIIKEELGDSVEHFGYEHL